MSLCDAAGVLRVRGWYDRDWSVPRRGRHVVVAYSLVSGGDGMSQLSAQQFLAFYLCDS